MINNPQLTNNKLDNCITIKDGTKELTKEINNEIQNAEKIILPSSISSIDARVFGEYLKEIEVDGNSIYCIVDGALMTKDNILIFLPKDCEIPDCTEIIAPYSCRFLEKEELILPNNIKEIQDMGFAGSKINSVICNEKLYKIGSYAFNSLNLDTGIESIKLNDELVIICDNAFQFTLLKEIQIPKNVSDIGKTPFDMRGELKKIEVDEQNIKYYSNGSNSIIEKETEKLIVGCKNTKIPNTVKEIGERAFYSSGLSKIDLPNSINSIGDYCFGFNRLKTVDISNVSLFGSGVFEDNEDLESVILPNNMKYIPAHFVSRCDNLNVFELPDSIELICTDAFFNFLGEKIIINREVKVIETRAISYSRTNLIYKGTKKEWLDIIGNNNIYYSEERDSKPKNYTVECIDGVMDVAVL